MRLVGQPGTVRGRRDAGRAGQHGDGLMASGRHRKDLARRAPGAAERVVDGVGLGGGVGDRRVGVDQPERGVLSALAVGDRPQRGRPASLSPAMTAA